MKRVFSLVLASLVAFGAFAADISVDTLKESIDSALNSGAGKINSGLEDFSKELQKTVPNVQTQQNVYSDAFIGKLFPEIPPHFAAGVNFGITQLNTEGLSDAVDGIQNILNSVGGLTKGLDLDMSVPDSLILPTITADCVLEDFSCLLILVLQLCFLAWTQQKSTLAISLLSATLEAILAFLALVSLVKSISLLWVSMFAMLYLKTA